MKHLVIVGGGTAGTIAANKLRAALPTTELRITVIDRDDAHPYQPGFLFVPFGTATPRRLVKSRRAQLSRGVDVLQAEVDTVDPAAKTVTLMGGETLTYDYLILASGVTPRPEATEGMAGPQWGVSVHTFYTLPDAQRLAEALRHFRGGRVVVHLTDMPIKCPVAPLEFTFLMEAWLRQHGIREKTTLTYVTPLDGAFTKPVAAKMLGSTLDARGIDLETDFAVASIDNEAKDLVSYDGRRVGFDLLVTIPLNMGADYVQRSGIGDDLNLVPCDQGTMAAIGLEDVWVLGDGGTLQTSKAGSVAHFSIDTFTENFLAQWNGRPATHAFDGHSNCFVETGDGEAMLLDFNYKTQPYPGTFPFPLVGPLSLLKPTRLNHLGKLAFQWMYWHLLLPGRKIPIPSAMSLRGKRIVADGAPAAPPARPAAAPKAAAAKKPAPAAAPRPSVPAPAARAAVKLSTSVGTQTVAGKEVSVDAEGFLTDYDQWDETVGAELAKLIGIELTEQSWGPIRFLRSDYLERGETATLRRVGTVGGFPIPQIFEWFPGKPAKEMAYIAGLPKPKGCV